MMPPDRPVLVVDRDERRSVRLADRLRRAIPGLTVRRAATRVGLERLLASAPPAVVVISGEIERMSMTEIARLIEAAPQRPRVLCRPNGTARPDASSADAALVGRVEQALAARIQPESGMAAADFLSRTVLDALPEHIAVLDSAGTIIDVNRAWREFADDNGLTMPDYCIGANYVAVARAARGRSSDGARQVADALDALLAGKRDQFHLEYPCHSPDRARWYTLRAVRIPGGGRARVAVAHEDVTACRLAQEKVRESEQLFRLMVEGSEQLFFFTLDLDQRFRYLSPSVQTVSGYSAEELLGEQYTLLLPQDAAPTLHSPDASAAPSLETVLRHKDGRSVTVEVVAGPIRRAGRVLGRHGFVRDISQRAALENKLAYQAFHDDLTGLPNRALLMDRLQQATQAAQRHPDQQFAVLLMDLDRFKLVNDSLGHSVGDLVLVEVGKRLQHCVRPEDTITRLGGDEFCILLESVPDAMEAVRIAKRIEQALREPIRIGDRRIFPGASIGIALSETGFRQPEDMLRNADVAMYRAKSMGTGYQLYDQQMHAHALQRLELESELRRALERDELYIEYQPIVSLRTGRTAGFEILTRWNHPRLGRVRPDIFIPVAEEIGTVLAVDSWALRQACRQLQEWRKRYGDLPLRMSVNLSGREFEQPGLVDRIREVLDETALDPAYLRLEITESVLLGSAQDVTELLHQLRALDIQLQIDDFGTGYSSLSYLHRFPIDALKIDRSFVSGQGSESEALLGTIVNLAHSLGMDAVGEGVETLEQKHRLEEIGCDLGQGYLFSPPISAAEAEAIVQAEWVRSGRGPDNQRL